MISQKTWPPGGGARFPYITLQEILKIFFSETTGQIRLIFCINSLQVTLYQDCSNYDDISKNMAARGRARFPYITLQEILKIFFSETTGQIRLIFGIYSLYVTVYQDCSNYDDISKNMAARGRGPFSLYNILGNFENLLL